MNIRKTAAGILSAIMIAGCVCALPAESNPLVIVSEAASKLKAPKILSAESDETSVTIEFDEIDGADGYIIYRYSAPKKKYVSIDSFFDTSYTVEDLEPGTTYRFKIAAYIEKNGKKAAQKQSKMIKIATQKLPAPEITMVSESSDSIKLKWDAVDGIDAYRVYYSERESDNFKVFKIVTKTECTVTGLQPETIYNFKVESLMKSGSKYKPQLTSFTNVAKTTKPAELKIDDFYLYEANGKEHKLSQFANKPMVIYFWTRADRDADRNLLCLNRLYKSYGDEINFVIIDCEGKSLLSYVKKMIEGLGLDYTMYYDWELKGLEKQGTLVTPYFMTIDKNGDVAKTFTGVVYDDTMTKTVQNILP